MRTVLNGSRDAIYDPCVLATGHVRCMANSEGGFEDGFIRLDLFICLSLLHLIQQAQVPYQWPLPLPQTGASDTSIEVETNILPSEKAASSEVS